MFIVAATGAGRPTVTGTAGLKGQLMSFYNLRRSQAI